MNCKLCLQPSAPYDRATVLMKHVVQYYQCSSCGFIQTEEPHWLDEAYASPINLSDIGLVGRNVAFSKVTQAVIGAFLKRDQSYLDYGGGYGLFVRLMRDAGLDFYLYDKHCTNLFARGFEVEAQSEHGFELVTAFEVFEHLVQPLETIAQMLQFSSNILFSTSLVPEHNPKLADWWYFGLDHGQHVAFYSYQSLLVIARRFGLNLMSDGRQLHFLTQKRLPKLAFRVVASYRTAAVVARLAKKPSLLPQDYYRITGTPLA